MRLDERLEQEKRKKQMEQRRRNLEDEETMDYLKRTRSASINEKGAVFESKLEQGINSDMSVFDKQALFFRGVDVF
ncbi:MAG: hypothetical protein SOY45_03390 [Lachnospiraceae bacterium]|nr:hypothetical protein [Lachnospiraceae bacterium]MDY4068908.1 hypothetical protein [Lachnospiraceae bacterium]